MKESTTIRLKVKKEIYFRLSKKNQVINRQDILRIINKMMNSSTHMVLCRKKLSSKSVLKETLRVHQIKLFWVFQDRFKALLCHKPSPVNFQVKQDYQEFKLQSISLAA